MREEKLHRNETNPHRNERIAEVVLRTVGLIIKEELESNETLVTVKEVKGSCEAGFKVGDRIVFIGDNVMQGEIKCVYGINAIWALLHTLGYGGKIPESSPFYNRKNDTYLGFRARGNGAVAAGCARRSRAGGGAVYEPAASSF